jgi:hypothetical protein
MFPTTVDAIRAILRADPTVMADERAWILACVRSHGRQYRNQQTKNTDKRMISADEAARRFGRSKAFVHHLAKKGIIHKVILPKCTRACGFYSDEIDRLLTPPEVPPDLKE